MNRKDFIKDDYQVTNTVNSIIPFILTKNFFNEYGCNYYQEML